MREAEQTDGAEMHSVQKLVLDLRVFVLYLANAIAKERAKEEDSTDALEKNPRVRKIRVRDSGAGNGRANFMDARKKCFRSAGKSHVHKIPRFRGGGGVFWVFGGGGGVPILFLWARGFF